MVKDITDKTFESEVLKSNTPVAVDMWAPWCGPCRVMGPVFEAQAAKYDGKIKFCRMNVDENPQTAAKYRIMSIPTIIMFKGGQIADTVVGAVPERTLQPKLDALL
jgi:thioredoxin 1